MSSKIDLTKFEGREYLPEIPAEILPYERPVHDPAANIKAMSTREILSLLESARCYHCGTIDNGPCRGLSIDAVKAELATREHVPNKNEARVLRRLMSENKLTEDQVRAIPKYRNLLATAAAS